jgi:MoaA/NifB/PqqE/SkfB family radical SAM enzyme
MSIIERQKNILKIPKEYREAILPAPKSVKIEITSRCNYRCKFCALSMREKPANKDMSMELFKRITAEMRQCGVEEFGVFYIGESFINPIMLIETIEYLKKDLKAPYVFLTSNASLASPEIADSCMASGLDSLKWSCNVCDEEQFKRLIGVDVKFFKRALANIKYAFDIRNKRNYSTKLSASSIKYNDGQMGEMQDFLREHIIPYVDLHYWLPLYSAGGEATEKEGKLGYRPVAGNTGRCDDPSDPIPCWTLFTGAHVLVDGRLTGCCLDGTGKWVMGDLKTQRFMEAWNSPKFVELRQRHLDKDIKGTICEKCALMEEL